jgi:class 3 adenylate cyclase
MPTTTATRRLTAILAADVVGYSRLMGADEEGTHERFKAHLSELLDPKIREHHGRIVKTTGDGVLAEFASVVDAVRCAGEIQRAMADRDLDLAEERRLRFRIGVNLGDVIAEGDDIYGDGVNIAARLEGLAAPGSICVSGTVRDHIGDRLPYAFEDMGEQNVKNIARPVRAYALRPEGLAAVPARGLPARPSRRGRVIISAVAAAVLVVVCIAWWFWPAGISPFGAGKPADQATTASTPMPTAPAATSISQPLVAPRLSIVVLPLGPIGMSVQTYSGRHVSVAPDGTLELSEDDAQPMLRDARWRKLGEWIEDEPIKEQNKPEGRKVNYAIGSMEWEAQRQQEESARIEAEARREKRRLARVAMVMSAKS